MRIAKLTEQGIGRVLMGAAGMLFPIDHFGGVGTRCAQVRDYRYPQTDHNPKPYQMWTLGPGDFLILNPDG